MLVNLTPHVLNIFTGTGDHPGVMLTLSPCGQSVRVAQTLIPVGSFDEITLYSATYGALEVVDNATKAVVGGLPQEVEGTVYVVSGQALEAIKALGKPWSRADFAAPGELVRDSNGQPVGCNGLKV